MSAMSSSLRTHALHESGICCAPWRFRAFPRVNRPFELTPIPALAPHPGRCKRPDCVEPNHGYCSFSQLPVHQTRFYGNSECGDWTSMETEDLHMQRQRLVSRRNELVTQT